MARRLKFQPLFLENLVLSIPGFTIQRFAYHRHSSEIDSVHPHKHTHSQFLLYLRGQGIQIMESGTIPVMRGSLLYLPPRSLHGFMKSMKTAPLSIVFDFKEKKPMAQKPISLLLPPPTLSHIEQILHQLIHSADQSSQSSPATVAETLTLFALLHQNALGANDPRKVIHPVTTKVRRLLKHSTEPARGPSDLARELGEDLSSLNRKLRNECGLNLGKIIDEYRLELSYKGLRMQQKPIAETAWDAGFQDPNYFARWFRKKVGQSPREWRRGIHGQNGPAE